jgi:hypothetical protein
MEPISIGLKIGGATGLSMFAVTNNLEGGTVGLAVAIPSAVFISGIVWWLGRKFQQLEDGISRMQERIASLPCNNCVHNKKGNYERKD